MSNRPTRAAMGAETWRATRDLFERVLDLEEPERAQVLAASDAQLRHEVERLLAAEDNRGDFLEPPHDSCDPAVSSPQSIRLEAGARLGPFRIQGVLASGGTATVYEALQDEPSRKVALKVMARGLADEAAHRRFRYEAELLGRLHHPCIAQVYDAGVLTTNGLETPWFALEYIDRARPLTDHADELDLSLRDRIRLMLPVLEAVQHGHQRGVVHRDLKPGNVLVDREGRVRVIDFGVARTIGAEATEPDIERTRAGEVIGTLRYMSPEQLAGRSADVDARADVYALGVLLHELVTGRPPYDLTGLSLPEIARLVTEQEPRRPSADRPDLPVDIDWVCARAMAKEPERRYASASELAADLEHFLANEPVSASPPSGVYQFHKFIQRHRIGVTAGALVVLAVVLGMIGTLIGWRSAKRAEATAHGEREAALAARAEAQAERTEALVAKAAAQTERAEALEQAARSDQMLAFLLDALESSAPRQAGRDATMLSFLEDASERIAVSFADRPRLAGWMHLVVGRAFHGLGVADEAERHVRASIEARRVEPIVHRELAESLVDLSVIARDGARVEEAGELLAQARAVLEAAVAAGDPAFLRLRAKEAQQLLANGSSDAIERLIPLVDELERELGATDRATLIARLDLGRALQQEGRLEEAEGHYRAALDGWVQLAGPDYPEVLRARAALIVVLFSRGLHDAAAVELEELLSANRRVLGDEHPDTVSTLNNLASVYYLQEQYGLAAPLYREAFEILRTQLPDQHPMMVLVRANLGTIEVTLGNADAGEPHLRAAYEARVATLGETHDDTLRLAYELARVDYLRADYAKALEAHQGALTSVESSHGRAHPRYARFEIEVARALFSLGRVDQARDHLEVMLEAYANGLRSSQIVTRADVEQLLAEIESD